MKTRGTTLVEASPYDRIYGIGLPASDRFATDYRKWRGMNLLGFKLTDIRIDALNESGVPESQDFLTEYQSIRSWVISKQ